MEPLDQWIARQQDRAAAGMLMSVSAVDIVKARPGFGQTMRPCKGSIVASPVPASYDPDPDYFFHWYRDSAVVIDALGLLFEAGRAGPEALVHLADFVRFSRALQDLDGGRCVAAPAWRMPVAADFTQYLRSDADLAGVHGAAVAADTRVNPDGTLDITRWTRPQHDGPPLRALALLRWLRGGRAGPLLAQPLRAELTALVRSDLAFTAARWCIPSFDIWEEESGLHYYTLRMAAAALEEGAAWLDTLPMPGPRRPIAPPRADPGGTGRLLGCPSRATTARARWPMARGRSRNSNIAVILAAIHACAGGSAPAAARTEHGPRDPRMHATLARLEAVFDAEYPINRHRPAHTGLPWGVMPAMSTTRAELLFLHAGGRRILLRAAAADEAGVGLVRARRGLP